ncbi:threonylcarbamoyl-AMP synthase [Desulfurococcaceae archaeon MEX13E-LK6-19]|nr:threonylcarbamoyl-AMP synthase [Desulfurococcaceae archaeon MEX13E-LK6-19]
MKIIRTSYIKPSRSVVEEAVNTIKEKGVVVGITDTVYGVFSDPTRRECVEKVYRVKERVGKPIPVLASSIDAVTSIADCKEWVIELLYALWPGPVTVILSLKESIFPEILHQGRNKVGFRVPAAPLPRQIAASLDGFVTGTSANISGLKPAETIDEAIKQLGDRIDLYIDSGIAPLRIPSTVIEIQDNEVNIVRQGIVKIDVIKRIISQIK